jgi:hypothetical protein
VSGYPRVMRRLALFAAVVFALTGCGGGYGDTGGSGVPPGENRSAPAEGGGGLSLDVSFSPEPLRTGQPVTWSLEVTNGAKAPVTLTFPSGQQGDVVLLRSGTEAYRWSSSKFFAQSVVKETIGAGDHKVFPLEEKGLSVEPGDYDLVATLASQPAPAPVRRHVSVER